jgi:putative tricarboxylic transport membrane protein
MSVITENALHIFRPFAGLAYACMLIVAPTASAAWEPSKPVELIVPAGTGGGADKMARLIVKIVADHKLMPQPIVVVNKPGNSGAEGFLAIKASKGDPHQLIVTLSNLFTTPLATGANFNWKDMTPVCMMALDQFVLWVHADSPYHTAGDYIKAVRASPGKFRMGGTGSKQEDEIITRALENEASLAFVYVPLAGGGEVAEQLAQKKIDSSVNNPTEAIALWRSGKLRPLGVFDYKRLQNHEKVTASMSWADIPTMKEQGIDVTYLMLRGIFAAPNISSEAQEYYVEVMKAVTETTEWKEFIRNGSLKNRFLANELFNSWLQFAESTHKTLMNAQ